MKRSMWQYFFASVVRQKEKFSVMYSIKGFCICANSRTYGYIAYCLQTPQTFCDFWSWCCHYKKVSFLKGEYVCCILQLFSMQPHCFPQAQTTKMWGQTMKQHCFPQGQTLKKLQSWTSEYFFLFQPDFNVEISPKNATKHPDHDHDKHSGLNSIFCCLKMNQF